MKKYLLLLLVAVLLMGAVTGIASASTGTTPRVLVLPLCEAVSSGDKSGPPPEGCTLIPGTCGQDFGWKKIGRRSVLEGVCDGGLPRFVSSYATELYRTGLYQCPGISHPLAWFCEDEPFQTCCHVEVSCNYRPFDWGKSCNSIPHREPPPPVELEANE